MENKERYEIQGKIGEGGLGSIYRAFDRQLNRTVAIKRIHTESESEPEEAVQSILHESHALSALNSTNIVSVYDIDQDEDGPYVVMEYLEGDTLENMVTRAPLVEGDFLAVAEQSLEGLIAAHEVNLIHRDIKPSNLMFTWLPSGRFQIKILDFGLAKFTQEPSAQTATQGTALMGSIYFMAPEQFARKPLDARTDLYSLGCVLYYSLAGKYPFEGESATEVMAGHIQGNYPLLDHIRPDINSNFLRWLELLMALEPENRFPDAQSALDSLEETKKIPPPEPFSAAQDLSATGPVQLVTGGDPAPSLVTDTDPQHPLTVKMPTTKLPVWLLLVIGTLALVILILSIIALSGGKSHEQAPASPPPTPVTTPSSAE